MLKANVGTTDRALRIFAGLLLVLLSVMNVIGPWGWAGLILVATGVFSYCGLYAVLGLRTCPMTNDASTNTP
jgi:phosphatidylglycerophosphate synthase